MRDLYVRSRSGALCHPTSVCFQICQWNVEGYANYSRSDGMIGKNRRPTHSEAFRYVTTASDTERTELNCDVQEGVEAL